MDLYFLILIFFLIFILGILDSAFGQGFGTIGTPLLILIGIASKTVVPLILFSQAILGIVSTIMHTKLKNVDLSNHNTHDSKRFYLFSLTGISSVIIASIVGASLPSYIVRYYIGIIVTLVGVLLIINFKINFTWSRAALIGFLSAFNKGLAGGGYGPIVTGGQTITGIKVKNSVGVTLSSVTLICIFGFITWFLINGFPPLNILLTMSIASIISPIIGSHITKKLEDLKFKHILGLLIIVLGLITLLGVRKA